jgi:hypothetical protein
MKTKSLKQLFKDLPSTATTRRWFTQMTWKVIDAEEARENAAHYLSLPEITNVQVDMANLTITVEWPEDADLHVSPGWITLMKAELTYQAK